MAAIGGEIVTHSKKLRDPFVMLYTRIIKSPALATAPRVCQWLLVTLPAQPSAKRNGSAFLSWAKAYEFGITCKRDYNDGLNELCRRGLLVLTRPGARPPMRRASLYGVTWLAIAEPDPDDPHEAAPTAWPSDEWKNWAPPADIGNTGWTVRTPRKVSSRVISKDSGGDSISTPVESLKTPHQHSAGVLEPEFIGTPPESPSRYLLCDNTEGAALSGAESWP